MRGTVQFLEINCSGKQSTCQCRRQKRCGWIPGLGRSPGAGNRDPPQCFCLENPTDRGVWWATVHGVIRSWHSKILLKEKA